MYLVVAGNTEKWNKWMSDLFVKNIMI
jgi:hypothetical protein